MSKVNKVESISVRPVLALIDVTVPYNSFLTKRELHVRKTKDR